MSTRLTGRAVLASLIGRWLFKRRPLLQPGTDLLYIEVVLEGDGD